MKINYYGIYLEGPIGAGKSTLSEILANRLKADGYHTVHVPEPVDEWEESGIFKEFYEDMAGKSYEFQTTTFITRVTKIINAFKQVSQELVKSDCEDQDRNVVFIIERSIYSDRYFFAQNLYEDGLLTEKKYNFYKNWWNLWERALNFDKSGFVYLKPTLDECMDRYRGRGREDENVPEEYQQRLIDKHNEFFPNPTGITTVDSENGPVQLEYLTLEDNRDFRQQGLVQDEIYQEFKGWFEEKF